MGRGTSMQFKIMCNGQLVNEHSLSKGGMARGHWGNPFDILPPIGSIIEYKVFSRDDEEDGKVRNFRVISHTFKTEEDYNNSYKNEVCEIGVIEW